MKNGKTKIFIIFLMLLLLPIIFSVSKAETYTKSETTETGTEAYTPSTYTTCSNTGFNQTKCTKTLYSVAVYAKNLSNEWVSAEKILDVTTNGDEITYHYLGYDDYFNVTFLLVGCDNSTKLKKSGRSACIPLETMEVMYPPTELAFETNESFAKDSYTINVSGIAPINRTLEYLELTYMSGFNNASENITNYSDGFIINDKIKIDFSDILRDSGFTYNVSQPEDESEYSVYFTNLTENINDEDGGTIYLDPTVILQDADSENLGDGDSIGGVPDFEGGGIRGWGYVGNRRASLDHSGGFSSRNTYVNTTGLIYDNFEWTTNLYNFTYLTINITECLNTINLYGYVAKNSNRENIYIGTPVACTNSSLIDLPLGGIIPNETALIGFITDGNNVTIMQDTVSESADYWLNTTGYFVLNTNFAIPTFRVTYSYPNYHAFMMFNTTFLTTETNITESLLNIYISYGNLNNKINVTNATNNITETNTSWSMKPTPDLRDNLMETHQVTSFGFNTINVTNFTNIQENNTYYIISHNFNETDNNLFDTKEAGVTSQRPYLNITYTITDTTSPSITIKIPINYTNYTTSYLNFTIESNEALSNCNFTLDNWATQNVLSNNTNSTGFYYYNSTMKDGYYLAKFWCNDSAGNINNTANVNFGIDTRANYITAITPLSQNYTSGTNFLFNITMNESASDCNMTLNGWTSTIEMMGYSDGTENNVRFNYTQPTMSDGLYKVNYSCSDPNGNINDTIGTFFEIDTTPPTLTMNQPKQLNYTNISLDFDITSNEDLSDCNLTLDNFITNETMTKTTSIHFNFTNSTMEEGAYNVNISCTDMTIWNSTLNRLIVIDRTNVSINIITPENITYSGGINLDFNWTVNDSYFQSLWYNFDGNGTNTTITTNTTFNIGEGGRILYVYANDSAGNENYTNVSFTISPPDISAPKIEINLPTSTNYSTATTKINITANQTISKCWYSLDNWLTNTTLTNYNTTSTYDTIVQADGLYRLNASCNNSVNNIGYNESVIYQIDTTAPNVSIESPTGTITITTNIPFSTTINDTNGLSNCSYNVTSDASMETLKEDNTFFDCSSGTLTATYIQGQTYYFNVFANDTLNNINNSEQSSFTISSTATPASIGSTTTRYPSEYEEQDYLVCNTSETYWEAKINEKSSASIFLAKKSKRTLNLEINQIINSSNFTISCINQDANYNICEWVTITEESFILNENENKIIPVEITIPNYVPDFHKYYFNILISDGLNCNGEMPVELKINPIAVIFKTLEKRTFKNYNIPLYIPTALIFIITFVLSIVLNKKSDNIIRILIAFLFSISTSYVFLYLI